MAHFSVQQGQITKVQWRVNKGRERRQSDRPKDDTVAWDPPIRKLTSLIIIFSFFFGLRKNVNYLFICSIFIRIQSHQKKKNHILVKEIKID